MLLTLGMGGGVVAAEENPKGKGGEQQRPMKVMKMVHLFGTNARAECVGSLIGIELMTEQRVGMALELCTVAIFCTNLNECCVRVNEMQEELNSHLGLPAMLSTVVSIESLRYGTCKPTGRSCKHSNLSS